MPNLKQMDERTNEEVMMGVTMGQATIDTLEQHCEDLAENDPEEVNLARIWLRRLLDGTPNHLVVTFFQALYEYHVDCQRQFLKEAVRRGLVEED